MPEPCDELRRLGEEDGAVGSPIEDEAMGATGGTGRVEAEKLVG
jgi:hypothetical protein